MSKKHFDIERAWDIEFGYGPTFPASYTAEVTALVNKCNAAATELAACKRAAKNPLRFIVPAWKCKLENNVIEAQGTFDYYQNAVINMLANHHSKLTNEFTQLRKRNDKAKWATEKKYKELTSQLEFRDRTQIRNAEQRRDEAETRNLGLSKENERLSKELADANRKLQDYQIATGLVVASELRRPPKPKAK